jgi:lipopolysaccharide export LptBFGC system permease protein LptF
MSYRDRMIALIVIVVALVLAGVFAIVKPITTKISTNKASLASVTAEKEEIENTISKIDGLGDTIKSEYNESKAFAENFTDSRETYQADQFIQEYFNNNSVEVLSVTANEATNETIDFYSYTPNVVTYPLLEAADINGTIAEETAEKLKTSTVLASLESQEVEVYSLDIQFYTKKDDILALIDDLKSLDENILITNLEIDDYTFAEDEKDTSLKGYSEGNMTINFYVLQPLDEPVLN